MFSLPVYAQKVNQLDKTNEEVKFSVLQDYNFPFQKVRSLHASSFKKTDSLIGAKAYWLKVIVNNPTSDIKDYILKVTPNLETVLYSFNKSRKQWSMEKSDLSKLDKPWLLGLHNFNIREHTTDTFYVWVNVNAPNTVKDRFKAKITFTPKEKIEEVKQNDKAALWIGLIVLGLFFLNNLYVYLYLKDQSILYYLIIQLGGMIYITAYWYFFKLSVPIFSYILNNSFRYYDINNLLTHISIVIIFYAFVQLARSYLNTSKYLPIDDKILSYVLYIYVALSFLCAIINVSGYYIDYYTIFYDNIYCGILIFLMLFICIKATIKKLPLSFPFLLANILPLVFMLSITIYHIRITSESQYNYLLPVLAIISQALGFSIALVTRTRSILSNLKAKEIESHGLTFSLKEIGYLNKLKELELVKVNADIMLEKDRNKLLQQRLELNQRELALSTLNMVQKGELLAFLKEQLQKLNWMDRYHTKKNLQEINTVLENNVQLDSDWSKFKLHFEHVHPNFFEELKKSHPNLTAREIRLYTYFHMKLSHKEIAVLLGIDPASVRRAKTRLFKKMNISVQEDQSGSEKN